MSDVSTATPAASEDSAPTRVRGRSRLRRTLAWILLVLASILTFGVAIDVWVKEQLLSTPRWVETSDKILADPRVQTTLATYLVDEVYANVDVAGAIGDRLPEDLKGLAGPLAGALRSPATQGVERLLASSQTQRIWKEVNTAAHKTLVAVLEDKMPAGSSKDGKVTIDLGELVKRVATQLGLPSAIIDRIPADVGQVTIFQSDQLALIQRSVAIVNVLGPILIVVVVAMYAAAVWLAVGLRVRTLRNAGWSLVIVGAVIVTLRRLLGNYVTSMITSPQYGPTGDLIWAVVTRFLWSIGWLLIGWGVLIVLGMVLVGPSRAAHAVRRFTAPFVNSEPVVFWVGVGVLYLIIVWLVPTPALQVWWSVLLVAGVGAAYLGVLRRRSRGEFPDVGLHIDGLGDRATETWGDITGFGRSVAERLRSRRRASAADPVAQLQGLAELHRSGALSDDEFAAAKAKLLS
jgi:hypothetical protein